MTEQHIEFTVENAGERLDKLIVARVEGLSRTQIQALIDDGHVTVNEQQVKAGVKLRGGEIIRVTLPELKEESVEAEDMPLRFIYEDAHIAVIDKPAGLVVHPGVGNASGTLVNALIARYPQLADTERKGIVHRLDKDTSGLIVVGLTEEAIDVLMAQFQARSVDKYYLALAEKAPRTLSGLVDAPIARDPKQRKRMAIVREGKPAQTEFEVIEQGFSGDQVLIRCKLLTGRTHQIRVHLAFIGAPIVGDSVYGYRKQRIKLKRQFLHAAELSFNHPISGERMTFTSELPKGLQSILNKLR